MKLQGRFVKGRLVLDPVQEAICARECGDKALSVDIEPVKNRRTPRQNSRHWAVIVPLVQHALNLKRPGLLPLNKDETHRLIATAFGGSEETELGLVPIRTRTMDTKTFAHLDEQASRWLSDLGYHVPAGPEESVADAIEEAMA